MRLTRRFEEALVYSTRLHAGQVRKCGDAPYVAHLLGVAALVLEHGGDEDEAIAALLHDAVEDQGGAPVLAEIRERFGDKAARIVAECTDTGLQPKPAWRSRKEAYIAQLRHAIPSTLLVSAADKLHNARAILCDYRDAGEAIWGRFGGGKEGTLWYYRTLVEVLGQRGAHAALVEELSRTVCALTGLMADRVD